MEVVKDNYDSVIGIVDYLIKSPWVTLTGSSILIRVGRWRKVAYHRFLWDA